MKRQVSINCDQSPALDFDRVDSLNRYGISLMQKRSYNEAVACFNRSVYLQPNNYTAWYCRGDALANLGLYREALSSFERAIEQQPESHESWVFRAVMLIYLKHYSEALASCDRALELQPEHREAWTFRGVALQRMGHYKQAYASYAHASTTPTSKITWWQRVTHLFSSILAYLQRPRRFFQRGSH